MAITFNEIAELVARFGNSVVTEQANLAAPFVGKGIIQKQKHTGTVGIVNVKQGGMMSTGFLADGQRLPEGANTQPIQLAYHPKALFSRLSIPRIAALTAISKQDGVNLVKEQMESVGADLGRTLGRAVFRGGSVTDDAVFDTNGLTPIVGTGANAGESNIVPSMPNLDVSGFRVGATYIGPVDDDPTNQGAAQLALVVKEIDHAGGVIAFQAHLYDAVNGVAGIVYPYDSLSNTPGNLNGPQFPVVKPLDGSTAPLGAPPQTAFDNLDNTIASLLDLASINLGGPGSTLGAAGNYAGIGQSGASDFVGSEVDAGAVGGNLTLEQMDELSKKIKRRSGSPWTHSVCNSTNMHRYMNLLVSNRQFVGGNQAADASIGSMATFEGKPVIVDENMPDTDWLLFTQSDVKLAQWRDFEPDFDGSKAAMVSDSSFIYDTQIFGMYNLRCTKRSGLGKITGLTATSWGP